MSTDVVSKPTLRQLLLRRKVIDMTPSNLARKLGTLDLTFLGMGATLGAGAYVLVGVIARTKTGPSIVLSFLIAGLASILSALCYAEFGARVPKAGSAYVYSYVTIGEIFAFTTGLQLLLEYIIGGSSVARAWSGYLNSLTNGAISNWFLEHVGSWHVNGLASYPDFLAFAMTVFLSFICSVGVKESAMLNNFLTAINVVVIAFAIIAGSFYTNTANFTPFAPFGVSGIFTGAATAFYSYVGFDVIATSAEETKNPAKAIPIAIITSLVVCMALYMAVAAVVTLMVPYAQIDTTAPLSSAFALHGATWAQNIIAVGAVCGLSTSLMTSIFPMPRIVYAISQDGLLPAWLGKINSRFNTPLIATMICGTLAGLLALILDLDALADMMSIGTLISYTLVAASVLVLRFRQHDDGTALRLAVTKYGALHPLTPYTPTGATATATSTTETAATLPSDEINGGENTPLVVTPAPSSATGGGNKKKSGMSLVSKAASAAKMALSSSTAGADGGSSAEGHRKSMESPLLSGSGSGASSAAGLSLPGSAESDAEATALANLASAAGAGAASPKEVTVEVEVDAAPIPISETIDASSGATVTTLSDSVDERQGKDGLNLWGFWVFPRWRSGAQGVSLWTCGHGTGNPWTAYSSAAASLALYCFAMTLASVGVAVLQTQDSLTFAGQVAMYAFIAVGLLLALYTAILLVLLPQAYPKEISFVTPGAPILPLVSVAVNIYLLVSLSPLTWVRFAIWCFIGFVIYGCYGIRHSKAVVAVTHAVLNYPLPPAMQAEIKEHHRRQHPHTHPTTQEHSEAGYGSINSEGDNAPPLTSAGARRSSLSGGSLEIRTGPSPRPRPSRH